MKAPLAAAQHSACCYVMPGPKPPTQKEVNFAETLKNKLAPRNSTFPGAGAANGCEAT